MGIPVNAQPAPPPAEPPSLPELPIQLSELPIPIQFTAAPSSPEESKPFAFESKDRPPEERRPRRRDDENDGKPSGFLAIYDHFVDRITDGWFSGKQDDNDRPKRSAPYLGGAKAEDTIRFACPGCGEVLAIHDDLAGSQVRCPQCDQEMLAPTKAAPILLAEVVDSLPPPNEPRPRRRKKLDPQVEGDTSFLATLARLRRQYLPTTAERFATFRCIHCGSTSIPKWRSEPSGAGCAFVLGILVFWPMLLLMPFMRGSKYYVCRNCGIRLG
jgi:predicted RNA-binding Zn-ribbon protein involved in translation (DUF1610 family)